MFFLTMLSSVLLVLGYFAYINDGNLFWFIPGIVAYIISALYWAKKPPKIVYDYDEEEE